MIYRAVSLAKVNQVSGGLDVAYLKGEQRLIDTSAARSNGDLRQDRRT
jgi:hypothetical protein